MNEQLLQQELEKTAARKCWEDAEEFGKTCFADDASGGNFDDCFDGGYTCGEVQYARMLLKKFFADVEIL